MQTHSGQRGGQQLGVIFRIQDNNNHYCLRLTIGQLYSVSVIQDGQWQNLIDWSRTSAIKPRGANRVDVTGRGMHFTILINGQFVCELDDGRFQQGLVGLAIETYTQGEENVFDFLDLQLRAP